jgi:holo-[acyl-carrier protein] synthase
VILGIGIDIIEVERIAQSISRYGNRFCDRLFAASEQSYCESKPNKFECYAARFAVKEAVMKAFGYSHLGPVAFKDIVVLNDQYGKPNIHFYGKAEQVVKDRGVKQCSISISHTQNMATAIAILE